MIPSSVCSRCSSCLGTQWPQRQYRGYSYPTAIPPAGPGVNQCGLCQPVTSSRRSAGSVTPQGNTTCTARYPTCHPDVIGCDNGQPATDTPRLAQVWHACHTVNTVSKIGLVVTFEFQELFLGMITFCSYRPSKLAEIQFVLKLFKFKCF